jgi:hypothetical protein
MNFFERLYILISGNSESASKTQKALRQIAQKIRRNKYRKFYKIGSKEIRPGIGAFFLDMYKVVYQVPGFMQHAEKSTLLKHLIVESVMDTELQSLYERFSPESIEEQAKTKNHKELSQQLEKNIHTFSSALNNERLKVERCYELVLAFDKFVKFDFFSPIKKLAPQIKKMNLFVQPKWIAVRGKYLVDAIKDFLELPSLEASQDEWKTVFEVLRKYNGVSVIEPSQWKKMLLMLEDVQHSNILVLMVQHIEQNPNWHSTFDISTEDIIEWFLKDTEAEVQAQIIKITKDKWAAKQDALAKELFGIPDIIRLEYYTNSANEVFIKRNVRGFSYVAALNYLMGFFVDYHDVRDLCNFFVIRGKSISQEVSHQISYGLFSLTDIFQKLSSFDMSLSDNGTNGIKLKTYINTSSSKKGQITNLEAALSGINERAKELISNAITAFSLVGACLMDLHEDYTKNRFALLINWKEMELLSESPIAERMEQSCKIIDAFVNLLKLFVADEAE